MQRSPSPYRASSPYSPRRDDPQHNSLPTGTAQVGPGAITYTTSTGPDGRIVYQTYRAVAASYQTPNGVVSGIQWVPDPTAIPPSASQYYQSSKNTEGDRSYGASYASSYSGSPEWDRSGERHKKRDDTEPKRRSDGMTNDPDYELRIAREKDAQSTVHRERRKSFNSGSLQSGSVAFPVAGGTSTYPAGYTGYPSAAPGYPSSPYSPYSNYAPPDQSTHPAGPQSHSRSASGAYPDITRQMKDMDLASKEYAERGRNISGDYVRARKYSTNDRMHERTRTTSGTYTDRPNTYPLTTETYPNPGPYANPVQTSTRVNPYPPSQYPSVSPNLRGTDMPSSFIGANSTGYPGPSYAPPSSSIRNSTDHFARSTTPFGSAAPASYSVTRSLDGHSATHDNNSRSRVPSRASSPNPAFSKMGSSPRTSPSVSVSSIAGGPQQLPAPEAFFRPLNAASPFTPFEMMKIRDLDDIYDPDYPKMPRVLSTHDIFPEDWKRCMQDLGRCWTGQLPVPGVTKDGQPPKRSTLAKDLVNLWNTSFFFSRGVELILYKGRERRTGPQARQIAVQLPPYHDASDTSSSPNSVSDSDFSGYEDPALRRRREEKLERRRRHKEKKARRKARARDKVYTAYIACLPQGPPLPYSARPPSTQAGYVPVSNGPSYGMPTHGLRSGMPTTANYGHGAGY